MTRTKSNKPKKGFCEGYKTYNPTTEGYGDANQWKEAFNQRMGYDEAVNVLGVRRGCLCSARDECPS